MLFATFVLVSVNSKHDCLEQSVDFGHRNKATQVSDVPRLGLEQKEQISIFLRLVVVREEALLQLGGFVEVACDLVLLCARLILA